MLRIIDKRLTDYEHGVTLVSLPSYVIYAPRIIAESLRLFASYARGRIS